MRNINFNATDAVWKAFPDIVAVWVFGSAQNGRILPNSDLDIAVLFKSSPNIDKLADLRAALQDALKIDEIDLLVLNAVDSITGFEAVSGRTLFCRDPGRKAEFVSGIARQYEDDMAFLARGLRAIPASRVKGKRRKF